MTSPKVALVYDWATTRYGGAEKVLEALHLAFPEAPLFTSVYNEQIAIWAEEWTVIPSFLQKIPGTITHHRALALFLPVTFEGLELQEFDIVVTITSGSTKGVMTSPQQLHISYVLTPPRYVYTHVSDYFPSEVLRAVASPFLKYLQWWDQVAAHRPDKIIAISQLVAQRIAKSYSRKTDRVVYPPVNFPKKIGLKTPQKPYFLIISRLVSYKRIDLAIQACLKMGEELFIIGDGPQGPRLQSLAAGSPLIHFLGHQSPENTLKHLVNCTALLMPGIEDFGITAAEAVAAGKPCVVHEKSGVAEILSSKNAVFLKEESVSEVVKACQVIKKNRYNPEVLRQSIRKYATTTFVKNMKTLVDSYWTEHQERML